MGVCWPGWLTMNALNVWLCLKGRCKRLSSSCSLRLQSGGIKLNLLTIKDILALQELKLYYKFIHNNLPPYIQQWQIKQNTNIHHHYTRNQNKFYIAGTKHAFAKQCLRHNLPNTLNATPQIVKDKLFTHSFYGFTNYVKYNFIQNYQIICTVTKCYTCLHN